MNEIKHVPIELLHSHFAGLLFDFMGWLTSRKERLSLSSTDECSPAVEAITGFAKMRGLSLADAEVQHWQDILSTPQPADEPVANIRTWHKNGEQHAELWNWDKGIETLPDGEHDLYTRPQPAAWVGLTDQEIEDLWNKYEPRFDYYSFSCAIEAKLKEKNT